MWRDPRHEADSDYRKAWGINGRAPWGHPLRAAFYEYLPDAPSGPYVTREQARIFAERVRDVRDLSHYDSEVQWTIYEKRRLRSIYAKWMRRANGEDARFNAIGVQGGVTEKNRPKTKADRIAALQREFPKTQPTPVRLTYRDDWLGSKGPAK